MATSRLRKLDAICARLKLSQLPASVGDTQLDQEGTLGFLSKPKTNQNTNGSTETNGTCSQQEGRLKLHTLDSTNGKQDETLPEQTPPVETLHSEKQTVETPSVQTQQVDTPSVDAQPVEKQPVEILPVEKPLETLPVEKEPVEIVPVEKEQKEAIPVEKEPVETLPVEQTIETLPVEKQSETLPVEAKPVTTLPVEENPVSTLPVEKAVHNDIANGECSKTPDAPPTSNNTEDTTSQVSSDHGLNLKLSSCNNGQSSNNNNNDYAADLNNEKDSVNTQLISKVDLISPSNISPTSVSAIQIKDQSHSDVSSNGIIEPSSESLGSCHEQHSNDSGIDQSESHKESVNPNYSHVGQLELKGASAKLGVTSVVQTDLINGCVPCSSNKDDNCSHNNYIERFNGCVSSDKNSAKNNESSSSIIEKCPSENNTEFSNPPNGFKHNEHINDIEKKKYVKLDESKDFCDLKSVEKGQENGLIKETLLTPNTTKDSKDVNISQLSNDSKVSTHKDQPEVTSGNERRRSRKSATPRRQVAGKVIPEVHSDDDLCLNQQTHSTIVTDSYNHAVSPSETKSSLSFLTPPIPSFISDQNPQQKIGDVSLQNNKNIEKLPIYQPNFLDIPENPIHSEIKTLTARQNVKKNSNPSVRERVLESNGLVDFAHNTMRELLGIYGLEGSMNRQGAAGKLESSLKSLHANRGSNSRLSDSIVSPHEALLTTPPSQDNRLTHKKLWKFSKNVYNSLHAKSESLKSLSSIPVFFLQTIVIIGIVLKSLILI